MPQRCGIAHRRGTGAGRCRAAPNPRADWICGRRRADPFIWPSLHPGDFASRMRSRLRRSASRARGAQRCPRGSGGAAGAARWRGAICTAGCSTGAGPAAVRRHVSHKGGRSISAWPVQVRHMCGRMTSGASDASAAQSCSTSVHMRTRTFMATLQRPQRAAQCPAPSDTCDWVRKYRLSNDAGIAYRSNRNSSFPPKASGTATRPAAGGERHPAVRTIRHNSAIDAHRLVAHAYRLRRHGTYPLEDRHAARQVAALRREQGHVDGKPGQHDVADVQRISIFNATDAVPAARDAVAWVVDELHRNMQCGRRAQRRQAESHAGKEHGPLHCSPRRARCAAWRSAL
jgi:hypothetical protein